MYFKTEHILFRSNKFRFIDDVTFMAFTHLELSNGNMFVAGIT